MGRWKGSLSCRLAGIESCRVAPGEAKEGEEGEGGWVDAEKSTYGLGGLECAISASLKPASSGLRRAYWLPWDLYVDTPR